MYLLPVPASQVGRDFHLQTRQTGCRDNLQVTSKRVANAKSDKYHGNILKRGKVELTKVCGRLAARFRIDKRCWRGA